MRLLRYALPVLAFSFAVAACSPSVTRVPADVRIYDPAPVAADSLSATGRLEGRVFDAETGEPLIGANVFLPGISRGAATDIDGQYLVLGIPAGSHSIQFSFAGMESRTVDSVVVRAGHRSVVEAELVAGALHSVEVVYERPMIQNDAIGVGRRAPDYENQGDSSPAGRRVADKQETRGGAPPPPVSPRQRVAAIQAGVVSSGYIDARGGRSDNLPYYVDGVDFAGEPPAAQAYDRDQYAPIEEAGFVTPLAAPLSTFSIDVDRASYANVRRMLMQENRLPPPGAVRVEEFVNAFEYDVPGPDARGPHPFALHTEVAAAPWAPEHQLVRVALQGRRIETEALPPLNLVFLLDVSGSMSSRDKLDLVKSGMRLLVSEMRQEDRVAIVVYAGAAGLVLPPTDGAHTSDIYAALDRLQAGGSTAGGAGLRLAYATAREHFDPNATNRVILATDGDFNVGVSSDAEMQRLIEEERASGVFLSVLGVGRGNLQDAKMETLADHGNGNYAYIDSIREAERVLVREMGGTLVALAKDVKIQVEFNPALVESYRLIGYENRRVRDEEFNDDTRDAGELGAGHSVTALYEVIPMGVQSTTAAPSVDSLRYQTVDLSEAAASGEMMTVKLRYKPATGPGTFSDESVLLSTTIRSQDAPGIDRASEAMRWAVAVTEGAMLLRESAYVPGASYDHALALASGARGQDPHGDRAEFVRLLQTARALTAARGPRDPQASTIPD